MKILIGFEEKVTRNLIIDTDNYKMPDDEDKKVFEIAKLINEAKEDPANFFIDDPYAVSEERERISVIVEPVKV